jgi:hypothetical protein
MTIKAKPMLFKVSTDKTVTEAAVALQVAFQANHFGVMPFTTSKRQ